MPEGIIFNEKTGTFTGCPSQLGRSSWKVTAANSRGNIESPTIVIVVKRSPDERGPPKNKFDIPKELFEPVEFDVAFQIYDPDGNGKLGYHEMGAVLRACGKTPLPVLFLFFFVFG